MNHTIKKMVMPIPWTMGSITMSIMEFTTFAASLTTPMASMICRRMQQTAQKKIAAQNQQT